VEIEEIQRAIDKEIENEAGLMELEEEELNGNAHHISGNINTTRGSYSAEAIYSKLRNITNFVMLFQAVMKFLSRLV
jgi:hypothetical protein